MAEATFRSGEPIMVDYTPASGNIAAGQVVLIGSVTANTAGTGAVALVAHTAITNNTIGAMAAGGGIYEVTSLENAVLGTIVYWVDATNKVSTTSTNNAKFGYVVANAGGGANTTVRALHDPLP